MLMVGGDVAAAERHQWAWDAAHYLEGVRCSSALTQGLIKEHVHALYKTLIQSLLQQQQHPEKGSTSTFVHYYRVSCC